MFGNLVITGAYVYAGCLSDQPFVYWRYFVWIWVG